MNLISTQPFCILGCFIAVKSHFKKSDLILVNMEVPKEWNSFREVNYSEEFDVTAMVTIRAIEKLHERTNTFEISSLYERILGPDC